MQHNFGHDTQGYCVSVFAANGPTKQSVVYENLCLNNGLSPRLARRQGAILLMTWNGGSIDGLNVAGNRIDWKPDGDTPVIRAGSGVQAKNVSINRNEIHTTSTRPVDSMLPYTSTGNRYFLENATSEDLLVAKRSLVQEPDAHVELEPGDSPLRPATVQVSGWRLVATVTTHTFDTTPNLAALFINLKTAALEYSHAGLAVSLAGDTELVQSARDWSLPDEGVQVTPLRVATREPFSLRLISPAGRVMRTWNNAATPIELGLALRQFVGQAAYGRLSLEQVRATD